MKKSILLIAILVMAVMASSAVVYADKKVSFGDPNFPTPGDPNNHVMIPDEVTVKVGETVRFQVHGFHQVLVYEVPGGTMPANVHIGDDGIIRVGGVEILDTNVVDPIMAHFPPNFIHHHNDRFIAAGATVRDFDTAVVDRDEGLNINLTFMMPGTYLALCGVQPHTVRDRMIGVINVE